MLLFRLFVYLFICLHKLGQKIIFGVVSSVQIRWLAFFPGGVRSDLTKMGVISHRKLDDFNITIRIGRILLCFLFLVGFSWQNRHFRSLLGGPQIFSRSCSLANSAIALNFP